MSRYVKSEGLVRRRGHGSRWEQAVAGMSSQLFGSAEVNEQSIVALVDTAQRGDVNALERLLAIIRPGLVDFLSRRTGAWDSEDLAQVVLIRVAGAIVAGRIEPARAVQYIHTVARNVLRTNYRLKAPDRRRLVPLDYAVAISEGGEEAERLDLQDLARTVHQVALTALTHGQRDVVLGLLRGETTLEIAQRLGIDHVTVRTRLMRARIALKKATSRYAADLVETERGPEGRAAG